MRLRRAARTRHKLKELEATRLIVNRTPRHIYAQVITAEGGRVIASASSVEKAVRDEVKSTGNIETASKVGTLIAERTLDSGVLNVSFDRSGYHYHGRIKALAEAARDKGLQF